MTPSIAILVAINTLPIDGGRKRRIFNLAQGLSNLDVHVDIFHRGKSKVIKKGLRFIHYPGIDSLLMDSKWRAGISNYLGPFNISPSLKIRIASFYNQYDLVQLEGPYTYCPFLPFFTKIPLVLDAHNVEFIATKKTGRIPAFWPYVYTLERSAIQKARLILAVSNDDATLFRRVYNVPAERIFVTPNGVDYSRFSSLEKNQCRQLLDLPLKNKLILFHGNYISWSNEEAAMVILNQIVPIITTTLPDCRFLIVGPNPSQRMLAAARKYDQVILTGHVKNPEFYIGAADIGIVPLLSGAGTKLKMLEYLAAGKPIICTTVAAEGLDLVDGKQVLIKSLVNSDFTDAILSMLGDEGFSENLSVAAREHGARFDWRKICRDLYSEYQQIFFNK